MRTATYQPAYSRSSESERNRAVGSELAARCEGRATRRSLGEESNLHCSPVRGGFWSRNPIRLFPSPLRQGVNQRGGRQRVSENSRRFGSNLPLTPAVCGELSNLRCCASLCNFPRIVATTELTNGHRQFEVKYLAPRVGFEPTTLRLTAT